jgi:hypothetical protein
MANPDTAQQATFNADSLAAAFPTAIIFVIIILFLFQLKDSIPGFKWVLWIGIPLITVIIGGCVNLASQYIVCSTTNVGKAFLGSLPLLAGVVIALLISIISYCRIPVASVFTPLIVGTTVDVTKKNSSTNINSLKNSKSKECCAPKLSLESIESRYPIIAGLAYGFYVMFGVLFGMVIGNSVATVC